MNSSNLNVGALERPATSAGRRGSIIIMNGWVRSAVWFEESLH